MIYPPQCLGCGLTLGFGGNSGDLCPDCWREMHFLSGTSCHQCGAPLADEGEADDTAICDDCIAMPRPWQQGRAAMVYAGTGRKLVLALKHGDRPDLAPALGGWLARAAAEIIRPDMIVAPVPLHLRRLLSRKYNQAALLSHHLARQHGLLHLPDLLRRTRHTQMQDHRGVGDRFQNLDGALAVTPRHLKRLQDRPVLLIDDVMTSGATLSVATGALRDAGAKMICVAVLARAVKEH